ncbi:MAG TPA: hypothetical protein VMI30_13945 [Stellaceae bacterium]|nr:hypothetical protein [Stellaceae bacterium]
MRGVAVALALCLLGAGRQSAASDVTISPEEVHAGCIHTDLRACMISLGSAFWFDMNLVAAQIARRNERDVNGRTAHRRIVINAKLPKHTEPIEITLTLASPVPNDEVVSVAVVLPESPDLAHTESEYDRTRLYDVASVVLGKRCPQLDKMALYRFYENDIKPHETGKVDSEQHGSFAQSRRVVDTPKLPFCGALFSLHHVAEWFGPPDVPGRFLRRSPAFAVSIITIE